MFETINLNEFDKDTWITSLTNISVMNLFNKIEEFVKNNYLSDEDSDIYYISYNGRIYEIGHIDFDDEFYYIKVKNKIKDLEEIKCFELDNVLNNNISNNEKRIKDKFDIINEYINSLKKDGVSLRLIRKSLNVR